MLEPVECPQCGAKLDADTVACPHCGALRERFEFWVTVVDEEGRRVPAHPDPIKRKEAEMAALFRSWSIRGEFVEDAVGSRIDEGDVALPPVQEVEGVPLPLPRLREGALFTPDVFSIDVQGKQELQMGFVASESVKAFGNRVVEAGKILIEPRGEVKLVGSPVGQGAVVITTDLEEEDEQLLENVEKTANALELVVNQEMVFEDFQDLLQEIFKLPTRPALDTFPETLREPPLGMIKHLLIIDARDEAVVDVQFGGGERNRKEMRAFGNRVKRSQTLLIEELGAFKYIGQPLGRGVVVLVTDQVFDDYTTIEKLDRVTYGFRSVLNYEIEYEDFISQLKDYLFHQKKVCIIGYGGVGKTTLTRLMTGLAPEPTHVPAVGLDIITNPLPYSQFQPYELCVWDFSGQDRFRNLWQYSLRNSHLFLLVTDSTLENVLQSKDVIDLIQRKSYSIPIVAIANKQDLAGALSPHLVQRILGVKAYGMVAIDPANRDTLLDIVHVELPKSTRKDNDEEGMGGVTPRFPPPPAPAP